MASLALIVSLIFLSMLLFGPLSMLADYFKFKILSKIFGAIAVLLGVHWMMVAPFPVSTLGLFAILTGGRTFFNK
jgi:hypothetical protein